MNNHVSGGEIWRFIMVKVCGRLKKKRRSKTQITVSGIGLEFFSSLESGFPGAFNLQSTVDLVTGIAKPVPL